LHHLERLHDRGGDHHGRLPDRVRAPQCLPLPPQGVAMTPGSIEVAELTKSFGERRAAVRDLTFRYEGTGAIGYLGPNGAGKTTTLKLLVGLLRPTSGQALLNDFDPW